MMQNMTDMDLKDKRVLIRLDLNVPMDPQGRITDPKRLEASLDTILMAQQSGAKIALMSHLGQPKGFDEKFSLKAIGQWLQEALQFPVELVRDWIHQLDLSHDKIILCENVRFLPGETTNHSDLAKKMASLCDVFINDAFASAHRTHASTVGVATFAPCVGIGPLIQQEMKSLNALKKAKEPRVAIVGGSKISTKLPLLRALAHQVNYLIVGGGIANTLLAACDYPVGGSLFEGDLIDASRAFLHTLPSNTYVPLPTDVIVKGKKGVQAIPCSDVAPDDAIMDIGMNTQNHYRSIIAKANTIIWNGPMGVFETADFAKGTEAIAHAVAKSKAYSVAGGGDTIAAIQNLDLVKHIDYISTGGGAFLSYLQHQQLPALASIQQRKHSR